MKLFTGVAFLLLYFNIYSQKNKGKIYLSWGYNRAFYAPSNIQFKGDQVDFTLYNVKAKDRPSPFDIVVYATPSKMWIPQMNYRMGYFINEKYAISFGNDHMKYVVNQYQDVKFNGTISDPNFRRQSMGNETISITPDFLQFEHTDGFNYVHFQLERFIPVYVFTDKFSFNLKLAPGLGFMYPRTDAKLMNYERSDKFHFAGLGTSFAIIPHFQFFKHFYIQSEWKGGYVNMFDVIVNNTTKAKHTVLFAQYNISVGAQFSIIKRSKKA